MNIRKFVLKLFVFCLFLSGQALLLSGEVYAFKMCCGCGSQTWCQYYTTCHCPGTVHCLWCAAPTPSADVKTVQSTPSAENPGAGVDIKGVSVSVLFSATERVLSDIRRKNGRDVVALKLLNKMKLKDNMGRDLKFGCSAIDDLYLQRNITFALEDTRK